MVRPGLVLKSHDRPADPEPLSQPRRAASEEIEALQPEDYGPELCRLIAKVRPELDAYLVTDRSVEDIAGLDLGICRRVFYNQEDFMELHLNILRGVQARYKTPFFTALVEYSKQPTGVFHAMPISRGKSITRSHWIQDMGAFYGPNIFLAETSATSGGLDSLLEPHGPDQGGAGTGQPRLRLEADLLRHQRHLDLQQDRGAGAGAARRHRAGRPRLPQVAPLRHGAGRARRLSISTAIRCNEYSMYGAVPLREIKHQLLALKAAGKLDRVRMLLLTNCTFDGIVYNVERVMEECLAIKPDLIFLWDEAWFAFARFSPTYRQRTAMNAANNLRERCAAEEHAKAYDKQQEKLKDADDETLLKTRLIPPPDARVRVYATQSTHKTLTSLRQGSMIHVNDQDFKGEVEQAFPRSLHDPHLDLAELPDHRLARCRAPAGRTGRLRVRPAPGRGGDVDAPGDLDPSAACRSISRC